MNWACDKKRALVCDTSAAIDESFSRSASVLICWLKRATTVDFLDFFLNINHLGFTADQLCQWRHELLIVFAHINHLPGFWSGRIRVTGNQLL